MKQLFRKYRTSPFAQNVSVLASGSIVAQVISVLISPVLSRIYSPEDYGLLAVFLSVLNMFAVVLCFRYELAIVLPKDESDAINLVKLCLMISSGFALILLILSFSFSTEIASMLGNERMSFWLPFLVLTIFITAVYNTFNYFLTRNQRYKSITKAKVVQSIGQSALSVGIGVSGYSSIGLLISSIAGQFIAASVLISVGLKKIFHFRRNDFKQMVSLIKHYKEFPAINLPLAIIDIFSLQVIVILISNFFSDEITGYYSFALRLLTIPSVLIGGAIGQVFYQRLSDLVNQRGEYKSFILQTWRTLLAGSIVPLIIIIIFAPDLFAFVFGENWRYSGNIASVLSVMYFFMFLTAPVSSIYLIFNQQKLALIFTFNSFIYRPLIVYLGYLYNDFMLGIILLVICESVNLVLLYSLLWRKVLNYKHP
ncbi:hypothetical protein FBQ84_06670 [Ignavibacteria bacterium CHB1]|nr:MAG: hypothetical protein EDM69_06720 [Chlorobiota bacterium]MBV6399197.1 hypothetical protein [Ignavibacteria bacterium]MCC6885356.1 oligosaccharide flippase family protein [Ignavibacteriales bacterium]MCE7953599.1 hypothetical protein [Chlorobi bacterium CHB7]MDL1887511.1 hypothetical protein [Ignavibacteria bacterium CHB1]RIK49216.1 MAG: hypothetical protein DCC60_04505 [Ignavibacteriota bacterium]